MNSKTQTHGRLRHPGRAYGVAAINRVADRIDLAIDLLTLGQYGLECSERDTPLGAGPAGCEGSKRRTRPESRDAWEAPRQSRRPGCEWPWPARCVTAGSTRD